MTQECIKELKYSPEPVHKTEKIWDSWGYIHLASGILTGTLIPLMHNPVLIILLLNILHGLVEWLEIIKSSPNEHFDKLVYNKITDCCAFLLGILTSSSILYFIMKNKSAKSLKLYSLFVLPITFTAFITLFLYEVWGFS